MTGPPVPNGLVLVALKSGYPLLSSCCRCLSCTLAQTQPSINHNPTPLGVSRSSSAVPRLRGAFRRRFSKTNRPAERRASTNQTKGLEYLFLTPMVRKRCCHSLANIASECLSINGGVYIDIKHLTKPDFCASPHRTPRPIASLCF